jgi:hypothetical protein
MNNDLKPNIVLSVMRAHCQLVSFLTQFSRPDLRLSARDYYQISRLAEKIVGNSNLLVDLTERIRKRSDKQNQKPGPGTP